MIHWILWPVMVLTLPVGVAVCLVTAALADRSEACEEHAWQGAVHGCRRCQAETRRRRRLW